MMISHWLSASNVFGKHSEFCISISSYILSEYWMQIVMKPFVDLYCILYIPDKAWPGMTEWHRFLGIMQTDSYSICDWSSLIVVVSNTTITISSWEYRYSPFSNTLYTYKKSLLISNSFASWPQRSLTDSVPSANDWGFDLRPGNENVNEHMLLDVQQLTNWTVVYIRLLKSMFNSFTHLLPTMV